MTLRNARFNDKDNFITTLHVYYKHVSTSNIRQHDKSLRSALNGSDYFHFESLYSAYFIYLFIYLFICLSGLTRVWLASRQFGSVRFKLRNKQSDGTLYRESTMAFILSLAWRRGSKRECFAVIANQRARVIQIDCQSRRDRQLLKSVKRNVFCLSQITRMYQSR